MFLLFQEIEISEMFLLFPNTENTALESIKVIWSQNYFTKILKKVFRGHRTMFFFSREMKAWLHQFTSFRRLKLNWM